MDKPTVQRWGPKRFWVDGEPPDTIDLSEGMQEALAGSQIFEASDGGLIISGYVGARTIDALRARGVIEQFSWGLTPRGLALVALLRDEARRAG